MVRPIARSCRPENEIEFQIRACDQFHVGIVGLLHRLALPQHRRCLLDQERLARFRPSHGRAMLSRVAGNQFDHYSVEYTFADGAKLFAFSRHMTGCWETYSDYAHGSKGSAVIMTDLANPNRRCTRARTWSPRRWSGSTASNDPNPYHAEWQVLLDAVRKNKPHNEAHRAAEASIPALMGRMAAHTGPDGHMGPGLELQLPVRRRHRQPDFRHPGPH